MKIYPTFESERDSNMFAVMVAYAEDTKTTSPVLCYKHLEDVMNVSDVKGWLDFVKRNRIAISRYSKNIFGRFFERYNKDILCMTQRSIKIYENDSLRPFPMPNVCNGRGKADFTFVKNEDGKEVPYVMSVKSCSISSTKKSIGITKSEIAAELGKENEIVVSKKNEGIKPRIYFATDVPVTNAVAMANAQTVSDVEELTIILPLRSMVSDRQRKKMEEHNAGTSTCKINYLFLEDMVKEVNYLMSSGMSVSEIFNSHYMISDFVLRACQKNMIENIIEIFKTHKIAVMEAFCRFGKTVSAAGMYKTYFNDEFRGKVIYYVSYYPDNFFNQADDFYKVFGGSENVLIHDIRKTGSDNIPFDNTRLNVVFVSVQYISQKAKKSINVVKKLYSKVDGFIFDETHQGINSDVQNECLAYLPENCKSLYITATPYSPKFHGLPKATFSILDKMELDKWSKDMYDNPIVVPYEYKPRTINGKAYKVTDAQEYTKDKNLFLSAIQGILMLGNNGISTKKVLKAIREYTNNPMQYSDAELVSYLGNFLMPCEDIAMADKFYDWLVEYANEHPAMKIRVMKSTSQSALNKNVNKRVNKFFEDRNYINIFIVVDQCTVGSTIKNLDGCIFMKNTVSPSRYLQIFGRCYERTIGKDGKKKRFTYFFDMIHGRTLKMSVLNLNFMTNNNPTPAQNRLISKLFGYIDMGEVVYPSEKDVIEMITEIRDSLVSSETSFESMVSNIVFTDDVVTIPTTPYNPTKSVVVYKNEEDMEAESATNKIVMDCDEDKAKKSSKEEEVKTHNDQLRLKLRLVKDINDLINFCMGICSDSIRNAFVAGSINAFDLIQSCMKERVGSMTIEEYIYG